MEKLELSEAMSSFLTRGGVLEHRIVTPRFRFEVECRDKNGKLKWTDEFSNTVMTAGRNDLLDKYFAGSSYTAAWYFGWIGATSYTTGADVGDTMASHGGWVEATDYAEATRPVIAFAAAASGAKATSAASVFTCNAGGGVTIKGAFVTTVATKGGTTGILFSAGLFTGGDRALVNLDVLNVTGTWTTT